MIEVAAPNISVSPVVKGIVYPTLEALGDDLFAHAFSQDHVPGIDYKLTPGAAGALQNHDLRNLAARGEETDERIRTNNFLEALVDAADKQLQNSDSVQFEHNRLDVDFGDLPVATPYERTGIDILRHPAGFLVSYLGGGYAGNGALIRLSMGKATDNEEGIFTVFSGLTALYGYPDTEGEVGVPMRQIGESVARAACQFEIAEYDQIVDELSRLWTPTTRTEFKSPGSHSVHHYDRPATQRFAGESFRNSLTLQHPLDVYVSHRFIFQDYDDATFERLDRGDDEPELVTYTHAVHPSHSADHHGNVMYALDPETDKYGEQGSIVARILPRPPKTDDTAFYNSALNGKIKEAVHSLQTLRKQQ